MDLIIAAAILAGAFLYSRGSTAAPTSTAPGIPSTPPAPISGGYQTASPQIGNFGTVVSGTANTGASLSAIQAPTVLPWAPPAWIGGIGGSVGTGGVPLGGTIRPGTSSGTGSTVVADPFTRAFISTDPRAKYSASQIAAHGGLVGAPVMIA